MKTKKKVLISALALVLIVAMLAGTAMAFTGTRTLEAAFRDITIQLNGQTFTPQDVNGKTVEPFIVDGTTYLPVRAVTEQMGYDVEWDGETNTVSIGNALPAQVKANRDTAIAFLSETDKSKYASYFADGAVYRCSLGGESVTKYLVSEVTADEWLSGLAADFRYVNAYAEFDITPVFTPVNEKDNDLIMAKMSAAYTKDGQAVTEYWTLEFTFNAAGKITMLRAALDANEENYLKNMRDGKYNYDSELDPACLRAVNLSTIEKWWKCGKQYKALMRKALVTDDATTDVFVGVALEQPMWVGGKYDDYTEGWLNPNATNDWYVYNLDKTGDPDKLFECADLPNVFLVDAVGYTTNSPITGGVYQPNYFMHITLRDDGYICNLREQSHGLDRLNEGFVDPHDIYNP